MNNIERNASFELGYIQHLAGVGGGKNPVGSQEMKLASSAQQHPISNGFFSGIKGAVSGVAASALGVLAAPFNSPEVVEGVLKPTTCWLNGNILLANAATLQRQHKAFVDYMQPIVNVAQVEQKLVDVSKGVLTFIENQVGSKLIQQKELSCGPVNYLVGLYSSVTNNQLVIGAAAVGLIATFTLLKYNAYKNQERQAAEDLKTSLEDKYFEIAETIREGRADPEIRTLARKILERKVEISQEVAALEVPGFTRKVIAEITRPVFEAAREVARIR